MRADVATLRALEGAFGFASVDELAILTRLIIKTIIQVGHCLNFRERWDQTGTKRCIFSKQLNIRSLLKAAA